MGTPSRTMKIPKFFTAFGILCIVGSINAQTTYGYGTPESEPETTPEPGETPVPIPESTPEPEPETTAEPTPPGEEPVTIPESDEPCYTPDDCLRYFGGKKGICVNMKELDITTIGRYYNRKEPGVLGPCKGSYQSDCCRCLKNKCKQSRHCHKKGGLCKIGRPGEQPIGVLGCKDKKGCLCYKNNIPV